MMHIRLLELVILEAEIKTAELQMLILAYQKLRDEEFIELKERTDRSRLAECTFSILSDCKNDDSKQTLEVVKWSVEAHGDEIF